MMITESPTDPENFSMKRHLQTSKEVTMVRLRLRVRLRERERERERAAGVGWRERVLTGVGWVCLGLGFGR
jgi:hypothetical protein